MEERGMFCHGVGPGERNLEYYFPFDHLLVQLAGCWSRPTI